MSMKPVDSWVTKIDVSNPTTHKKGYTLYKVTSKVFPKNSVEAVTEVIVWKRYNDFKKLHKALSTLHQGLYLKGSFPQFASTRFFGRFDPVVIEERRQSALNLLQFAANSPPLFTSQVFVKFFEDSHTVEHLKNSADVPCTKESILTPQKNLKPSDLFDSLVSKSGENSLPNQANSTTEAISPLGGIWQFHQIPDTISLGSQCTDDDDRTTFTDDDSLHSRPSLNLSEFDPLLQAGTDTGLTSQENLCNSWLLSAIQTCNPDGDRDLESILEFPTPFGDCEPADEISPQKRESTPTTNTSTDSKENHFTFDNLVPAGGESTVVSEFDPLWSEKNDAEEDSYDSFATTPNSYTKECRRPSYIAEASTHVFNAQEAEESGRYMEAFDSYKKAIDVLLQGFQKDKCADLRDAVRKKVLLYLMKAEEIYETKLPFTTGSEKHKIVSSSVLQSCSTIVTNLKGPSQELNKYKVLGILDKVLLVLDISNNNTYIVKTFYKSPSPSKLPSAHTIPQTLPFMVRLHHIYETDYALFLILQHATGGRLWDYVSSFLQRTPLTPCNDGTCFFAESRNRPDHCNVYSGKKLNSDAEGSNHSSDPDLTPDNRCPSSYVALFKKYADDVGKEENVSLAKYKIQQRGSKDDVGTQKSKQKNFKHRRSSSTGSLETSVLQKPGLFEAFTAMDEEALQKLPKTLLPESCICMWTAEIVIALEALHNLGIVCVDLNPKNILLGAEGHILLSYHSHWNNVDSILNERSKEALFCAPEVGNIFPVSFDCDWWSLGAIVFELLTGHSLLSCHPTGITSHTTLNFPTEISSEAKDLTTKFLQYNPTERLGSGIYGIEEIKCHPFFRSINWESLCK